MPYSKLLERAFRIVKGEPALWVLGFLVALFGGGGSSGSFNFGGGGGGGGRGGDIGIPDASGGLPANFNPEMLVAIGIGLFCVVLTIGILFLVLRSVALAGLIHGADQASMGEDVHWKDLWRHGWSRRGRRLVGLTLVQAVPLLIGAIIGFAGFMLAILPLIQSGGAVSDAVAVRSILGAAVILLPLVCILVIASWVLDRIGTYAARAVVLHDRPVMDAFRHGWQVLRANFANTFVLTLILWVIQAVVGFPVGIILLMVAFPLGLFLVIAAGSGTLPVLAAVLLAVPLILLLAFLAAALMGPVMAYLETTWTLAWQHLTGQRTDLAQEQPL